MPSVLAAAAENGANAAGGPSLLRANIVVQRERDNRIFRLGAGPDGGEFFLPWRRLRAAFEQEGFLLNTPDQNAGHPVAFEFHLNVQRRVPPTVPCYCFIYEDALIRPINADRQQLKRYRIVFTWNEEMLGSPGFVRLDYPNSLEVRTVPGWEARDLFCVMIASNKALRHPDPRNLHDARVDVIRFFERHAPSDFALYGHGWDIPAVRPGAAGRLVKQFHRWSARKRPGRSPAFPSWRGTVSRKAEILDRAKFAICYENSRGSPGYLTEKIFDCLRSGCVPVYIGSPHREHPIPEDCYIDGDRFANPADLLKALRRVDGPRFERYQQAMADFLRSPSAQRFGNDHWCRTLVQTIVADLRGEGSARGPAPIAEPS